MRIDIISCVPDLLQSPLSHSILQRAQTKGLLEVVTHDLRDYGAARRTDCPVYPAFAKPA